MISDRISAMTGAVQEVLGDVIMVSKGKRNPKLPQRVRIINPMWDVAVRECTL